MSNISFGYKQQVVRVFAGFLFLSILLGSIHLTAEGSSSFEQKELASTAIFCINVLAIVAFVSTGTNKRSTIGKLFSSGLDPMGKIAVSAAGLWIFSLSLFWATGILFDQSGHPSTGLIAGVILALEGILVWPLGLTYSIIGLNRLGKTVPRTRRLMSLSGLALVYYLLTSIWLVFQLKLIWR